jgi:hypothetical protein
MKVVAIASPRPGNGKSRFTWDLLVAFADAGLDAVAIDCGGSTTLGEHNKIRAGSGFGALAVFAARSAAQLTKLLTKLRKAKKTVVLLDVPTGDIESEIRPYLAPADLTLVTVRATPAHIAETAPLVRPLLKAGKAFHYLLVCTPHGGATYDNVFLARLGMTMQEARRLLLPMSIASRPTMIRDLDANGIGVLEALGNARVDQEAVGQASMELRSIRQFLRDELDF